MRILERRILRGPNVYHSQPVILIKLDLEEKHEIGSHQATEFSRRLVELLPGLYQHHCSPGYPGGFLERLERGTYFAHIVEHVALELSVLAGIEVSYGKTVYAGAPGHYFVVVRFKNEAGMLSLLDSAVSLVDSVYRNEDYDLAPALSRAREITASTALGPSTQSLVDAASRRGIPWRRIGEGSLIELGYGRRRRRLQAAVTDETGLIAADLVQDKDLTKAVLREAAIPTPDGEVYRSIDDALRAFETMRKPVAVKPLNGHHGQGVSLNISTVDELLAAFNLAKDHDSNVIIEEMCFGRDYRILVLNNEVVAAAERIPARVIGDGAQTIEQLIAIENVDPRRGSGHQNVLTKIEIDEVLHRCLSRQNLNLHSVPAMGVEVLLRDNANLSTGGTAKDVTDLIHPSVRLLCERAARATGLDICGIDLIHNDISKAPNEGTAIIEVNAGPGLRMHVAPTEGMARDIGSMIIDSIFPDPKLARIPIVAITGTNGKTTTTRMIARILATAGMGTIGMTTSDGIYIGDTMIDQGDTTGPRSARVVLSDSSVDAAVLEVARGGLLRGGLGYDWSDIGVVTNIRPDHFGQDGIEDIEDIVRIKSVIAERVREGGTIVLNADDAEASGLMTRPRLSRTKRNVAYYSLHSNNPVVRRHLDDGGTAYFVEDGFITEARGRDRWQMVRVADLAFSMNGTAEFQISNALAACAAARASGLEIQQVVAGLHAFENSRDNLGRMNVYRVGRGFVVLDYAHNPDAIAAISNFLHATGRRTTAVIGLPGDRNDELISEAARVAAFGFDRLIVREDQDLRGRAPGEVASLVQRVVERENADASFEIIMDGVEALRHAVDTMGDDEIVAFFYEDYESALAFLRAYDPVPVLSGDEFVKMESPSEILPRFEATLLQPLAEEQLQ